MSLQILADTIHQSFRSVPDYKVEVKKTLLLYLCGELYFEFRKNVQYYEISMYVVLGNGKSIQKVVSRNSPKSFGMNKKGLYISIKRKNFDPSNEHHLLSAIYDVAAEERKLK